MHTYSPSVVRFETPVAEGGESARPPAVSEATRDELQTCLDLCRRCHEICLQLAVTHCPWRSETPLGQGNVRLLLDCAQVCQTTADFISRDSPYHLYFCSLCGSICEACAENCELSDVMEECARLCRLCSASCLAIAA